MFGFSFITIILFIFWCILFAIIRAARPNARGAHLRMVTLLGVLLVFSAFFLEAWIEFDFLAYMIPTPELIRKLIPDGLVSRIIRSVGTDWLGDMIDGFDGVTSFNGVIIHFFPTLGPATWLITWLPILPLILSLPTLIAGLKSAGSNFARVCGGALLATSVITALSLLFVLPHLDAMGTEANFQLALLAAILGAKIGNGPWVCLAGLVLLAIGGLIEMNDQPSTDDFYEPTRGDEW